MLDSSAGALRPQNAANLAEIVREVAAIGYERLTIRFNQQGYADPMEWRDDAPGGETLHLSSGDRTQLDVALDSCDDQPVADRRCTVRVSWQHTRAAMLTLEGGGGGERLVACASTGSDRSLPGVRLRGIYTLSLYDVADCSLAEATEANLLQPLRVKIRPRAAWDETQYMQNWSFITSTRALVEEALEGTTTEGVYDLGGELAGKARKADGPFVVENDINHQYVVRLWSDYVAAFGLGDSYGFSFNYAGGTPNLANQIAWFDEAGTRPPALAFDVYGHGGGLGLSPIDWDVYGQLSAIASEMNRLGVGGLPVILQEVFYNDAATARDIRRAGQPGPDQLPITIVSVVQWPNSRVEFSRWFPARNFASVDWPLAFTHYVDVLAP